MFALCKKKYLCLRMCVCVRVQIQNRIQIQIHIYIQIQHRGTDADDFEPQTVDLGPRTSDRGLWMDA